MGARFDMTWDLSVLSWNLMWDLTCHTKTHQKLAADCCKASHRMCLSHNTGIGTHSHDYGQWPTNLHSLRKKGSRKNQTCSYRNRFDTALPKKLLILVVEEDSERVEVKNRPTAHVSALVWLMNLLYRDENFLK